MRTVAGYNEAVRSGHDPLGRTSLKHPVARPPYYALLISATTFITFGGLAVDAELRVLDDREAPDPRALRRPARSSAPRRRRATRSAAACSSRRRCPSGAGSGGRSGVRGGDGGGDMSAAVEPSLTRIGASSYLFNWPIGFYNTIFSVSDEGVIALDPLNHAAAAEYRRAIESVTDQPIRYVVYSHEHLDHITGAEVLAPDVPIIAHQDVPAALIGRGHRQIPLPTLLVDGYRPVTIGDVTWELIYLGPNHSRTNLAVLNRADRWVAMIDVISGGMVPYRSLPVSDYHGFMVTLDRIATLDAELVLDGHCPPVGYEWVHNYRRYFRDLWRSPRPSARRSTSPRSWLACRRAPARSARGSR